MIYVIITIVTLMIVILIIIKVRGTKQKITSETIIGYVGGLGSGKTLNGVNKAIKEHKKALKLWALEKNGTTPPLLISNIPLRYKYKGQTINSVKLTKEVVLMKEYAPQGSITFWDEIGLSCSQFDWDNENVKNELTEFIRLYRQYTKGGKLIITDQTLNSIVKPIRERINTISYCLITNKFIKLYCTQNVILRFTQKIDSYTADSMNQLLQRNWGIIHGNYSTYNYYERYVSITKELIKDDRQDTLNSTYLLQIREPKKRKSNNKIKAETLEKGKE